MKTTVDIEDLLVWAYRTELPKAQADVGALPGPARAAPAWNGVTEMGELGTIIDNRYGVVPDRTATSDPHPDAIAVAEAVASLMGAELDVPEDWWPFGDLATAEEWGDLGRAVVAQALERVSHVGEDGARRFKGSPAWLVRRYAVMGECPVWETDIEPKRRTVRGANGKAAWFVRRLVSVSAGGEMEVEQDGWSPTRRRPVYGAYQKEELSPSPFPAAIDRAEYEVWHAALTLLAAEIGDTLTSRIVTGPRRPSRPWISGMPQPFVLPCIMRKSGAFA